MATRLGEVRTPGRGFAAVLLRFVITSLASILSLYLLGRIPFVPSELVLLPAEKYYFAAITHSIAQLWVAAIQVVCFVKVLKLSPGVAMLLSVLINAICIALAMHFI